jgi:hypothetical protein
MPDPLSVVPAESDDAAVPIDCRICGNGRDDACCACPLDDDASAFERRNCLALIVHPWRRV